MPPAEPSAPRALGARALPAVWREHWRSAPERPALWDAASGWLAWGALERASARAAARLHGAGLAAGDRVLLSAAASVGVAVAHVACLRLGLVLVPANPAYRARELAALVREAEPRAALVDDPGRAEALRALAPGLLVTEPALRLPEAAHAPPLDAARPETPALLAFTSGTTGRPKGALLTHGNLHATVEGLRVAWRWSPDDRLVHALPLFHMHGLGVALLGSLHTGASAVLLPRFTPELVLDAIRAHGATLFFGVPTMWHRLAEHPRARALAALRLGVSGSAPLSAALHQRLAAEAGVRVLERYGMTETGMLTSNPLDGERRPGSVGRPLPGVELRLAADGEIQVRGPNVFGGYLGRADANAAAFTADGWFRTGDVGAIDPDGVLRIVGRAKELVISGGYNVHPREVEEALRAHPDVEDAAVVGTPSPEWGEVVTAYLVSRRELTLDEVRRHCAALLAPYKHPRQVHRVAALPKNALGKLQRQRLAGGRVLPEAAE